jgi:hypothetical protein
LNWLTFNADYQIVKKIFAMKIGFDFRTIAVLSGSSGFQGGRRAEAWE